MIRHFAVWTAVLGSLGLCGSISAAEKQRPNILFCFADDWGRYAGVYAETESRPSVNQVVKTPNIDRSARQGVLFKNAFVTAPVVPHAVARCCPASTSSVLAAALFCRERSGIRVSPATRCCYARPATTSAKPTRSGARAAPTMLPTAADSMRTRRPAGTITTSRRTRRFWSVKA